MTTADQNPHDDDGDLDPDFDPEFVDEPDDDAAAAIEEIENIEARQPERDDISPKEMDRLQGLD